MLNQEKIVHLNDYLMNKSFHQSWLKLHCLVIIQMNNDLCIIMMYAFSLVLVAHYNAKHITHYLLQSWKYNENVRPPDTLSLLSNTSASYHHYKSIRYDIWTGSSSLIQIYILYPEQQQLVGHPNHHWDSQAGLHDSVSMHDWDFLLHLLDSAKLCLLDYTQSLKIQILCCQTLLK